jgi:hypothetical protein
MARIGILTVLLVAVLTLASPIPSHAGFRSGFVAGFPVAHFSRPHPTFFSTSVVVVNRPFVSFTSFEFPARTVFVREVLVQRTPVVVIPVDRAIVIVSPVFVSPVRTLFLSSRCFVDQFGLVRCFP